MRSFCTLLLSLLSGVLFAQEPVCTYQGRSLDWALRSGGAAIATDKTQQVYTTGTPILEKYDASGSLIFSHSIPNAIGEDIALDPKGNIWIAGTFTGTIDLDPSAEEALWASNGGKDMFFAQYSAEGSLLYSYATGDIFDDGIFSLAIDLQNNIYFTGVMEGNIDFDPSSDTSVLLSYMPQSFVAKYTQEGVLITAFPAGPGMFMAPFGDVGRGIHVDRDQHIYLTGFHFPTPIPASPYIEKYDANGVNVYSHTFLNGEGDLLRVNTTGAAIISDEGGNAYVTGVYAGSADFDPSENILTLPLSGGGGIFLTKFNSTGELLFAHGWGDSGINPAAGTGITLDKARNIHISGKFMDVIDLDPGSGIDTLGLQNGHAGFIASFDKEGNYLEAFLAGTNTIRPVIPQDLTIDIQNRVLVTGTHEGMTDVDPSPQEEILTQSGSFTARYGKVCCQLTEVASSSIRQVCKGEDPAFVSFENNRIATPTDDQYLYVITNQDQQVVALPDTQQYDFNQLDTGIYRIYGLSYAGTLSPEIGQLVGEMNSGICQQLSSNFIEIQVNEPPQLTVSEQVDPTCENANGSITLSVEGNNAPYEFTWDNGLAGNNIEGLEAGTYVVQVTDQVGCKNELSVTLEGSSRPTLTLDTLQAATCGIANGYAIVSPEGGEGILQVVWDNGQMGDTLQQVLGGTYTATVTDSNTCTFDLVVEVESQDSPVLTVQERQDATCGEANGSITLSATSGTEPFDWTWNTGAQDPTLTDLAPGAYTATVTDANQCSTRLEITIDSISSPIASMELIKEASCGLENGAAQVLIEGGTPPFVIVWDNGSEGAMAENLASGIYLVSITDSNACQSTAELEIPDNGLRAPQAEFEAQMDKLTLSFTNLSQGADSYLWDFGDGTQSTLATPTHSYNSSGTYTIQLIAQNECGMDTFQQDITVMTTSLRSELAGEFQVYPNPTTSTVTLEINQPLFRSLHLKLINIWGQTVLEKKLHVPPGGWKNEIYLGTLAPGFYRFSLHDPSGRWVHNLQIQ